MQVPLTIATLALITLAIVILRFFWYRLPARLRGSLVYTAIAMILLRILFVASKWVTTSDRINTILNWAAVTSYVLIIVLFTLYRPKWLTTISAVILILPIFASIIVIPLGGLFDPTTPDITSIGNHLLLEKEPWDADPATRNTGIDLTVYYRPPLIPFMRHRVQRWSFNNDQCNSSAASVSIEPDRKHLRFHCPARPTQQTAGAVDLILPIK
jgi:hypothetical protein